MPDLMDYVHRTCEAQPKRPRISQAGTLVARPEDIAMAELLGYASFEGVGFTRDQKKALERYYGFTDAYIEDQVDSCREAHEARRKKLEEEEEERAKNSWGYSSKRPVPLKPFSEKDVRAMHQAGSDRNLFRHVRNDGLRVMAFLSKFLDRGEDPVELLEGLMSEAGFDCMLSDWEPYKDENEEW